MDNHERRVGDDWVVTLQGAELCGHDRRRPRRLNRAFRRWLAQRVTSDWMPGQPLARLLVDGEPLVLKVGKIPSGFRIRACAAPT